MLVTIMILMVLNTLFVMAAVGHMANIEKTVNSLVDAKLEEMKMWHGKQ